MSYVLTEYFGLTQLEMIAIICILAAFVYGVHLGKRLEAARWRHNASFIFRIESNGELFKVERCRPLLDPDEEQRMRNWESS